MQSGLYAILDTKSGFYGSLMTFKNDATALRAFQEMLLSGDKNSMLALYPTDYTLFLVGYYDQETGIIQPTQPQLVDTGFASVQRAVEEVNRRKRLQKALEDGRMEQQDIDELQQRADALKKTDSSSVSD